MQDFELESMKAGDEHSRVVLAPPAFIDDHSKEHISSLHSTVSSRWNKRRILSICIAASLVSHIVSLLFFQRHAFLFSSLRTFQVETASLMSVEPSTFDKILRESFQEGFCGHEKEVPLIVQPEVSRGVTPVVLAPEIDRPSIAIAFSLAKHPKIEFKPSRPETSFTLPPIEHFNLFEHLPNDLMISECLSMADFLQSPDLAASIPCVNRVQEDMQNPVGEIIAGSNSQQLMKQERNLPFSRNAHGRAVLNPAPLESSRLSPRNSMSDNAKALNGITSFELPSFPTLEDLGASSCSDFFDAEILFTPLENEKGYLFALTLVAKPDLDLPKIRQHYSFLIDRSNSMQKERLSAVKNAISRTLEELDLDDSFNILTFDSKIDKFAPAPLLASRASIASARQFLDRIELGSFFSTTNLFRPLFLTIPSGLSEEGVHTAILFSDGEAVSKPALQRELALDWTAYNNGRVSLFVFGSTDDSHLAVLDATAACNRGKLLLSPTNRGIKRKLLKLFKSIGHPVATDISVCPISCSSNTKISLYPTAHRMPHLYLREPYVILGIVNELNDFILFVQGKLKHKWFNIKKHISFVNAKKGGAPLKAQLALQQAYGLFEQYLVDMNPAYLKEVQNLLDSHNLPVAFR